MDESLKIFSRVLRNLNCGDLPLALDKLTDYARKYPFVPYTEELSSINESFQLMLQYMEQGIEDPTRDSMYREMLTKTNRVARNMLADYRRRSIDFYQKANADITKDVLTSEKAIRMKLEDFVGNVAMLDFEPEEKRNEVRKKLYADHYKFMQSLFCSIVVSDMWTKEQADAMTELMLLSTVDSADIQLMVSAVMLAVMNNFDINKFKMLVEVYQRTDDEYVKQKALVGWALSVSDKVYDTNSQTKIIEELCKAPETVKDLVELQKQVAFCMNAENDNKVIQNDIMPTLIKNSNVEVTRLGISEKENDPMQDILDPGAEDRAMEQVEEKFQQMMELQKSGADIYFGGFSQMKRFPFFYSLVNWFIPFNINHPDLVARIGNIENSKFLEMMLAKGPFCDSDKYSFALALSTVFDRLPANIREMMAKGELGIGGIGTVDLQTPAYIRRQTLQDLYRFFRLYDKQKQIYNPFTEKNWLFLKNEVFDFSVFQEGIMQLGYFLMSKKTDMLLGNVVELLNSNSNCDTTTGRSAMMLCAAFYVKDQLCYPVACELLKKLLDKEPDNVKAMTLFARASLLNKDYEQAKNTYAKLINMQEPKKSWLFNYAIALTKLKEFDSADKALYRLDFECPDTPNVKRALAWTLVWQKKLEQAAKIYDWLLGGKELAPHDYLNAAYCFWFMRNIKKATDCMVKYVESSENDKDEGYTMYNVSEKLYEEFEEDDDLLQTFGINETEKLLVSTIVYNKLKEKE